MNLLRKKYYKEIQESLIERNISENNHKIKRWKHKYSIIYRTLLNKPLKQVKNILPALQEKENLFFNEEDEMTKTL